MTEFLHLKSNLHDLWSRMESHNGITTDEDLAMYVDMLLSMSRYYKKMGSDYRRRVKLNEEFNNEQ